MSEEASINVPAIAAAHVTKRYTAQATDELTFEVTAVCESPFPLIFRQLWLDFSLRGVQVGDIVSVIDMPPKEDTGWWRGKHGFQVASFISFVSKGYYCVAEVA